MRWWERGACLLADPWWGVALNFPHSPDRRAAQGPENATCIYIKGPLNYTTNLNFYGMSRDRHTRSVDKDPAASL